MSEISLSISWATGRDRSRLIRRLPKLDLILRSNCKQSLSHQVLERTSAAAVFASSWSFQLLDLCDIKLKPCSSVIYQIESQLPENTVYSIVVRIQSISRMYSATFSHIYGNSSRIVYLWEGHLVKARIYWIPRRAKWEAGAHVIFKHKLLSSGPFGPKHLGRGTKENES